MAASIAETLDSLEVFLSFYVSEGVWNGAGYANTRVDELIATLRTASLTYARDAFIEDVWKIVQDDVVYLPLHHQVIVWALGDNVDVPVSRFDAPVFREARFR
jgi:peptide/nickel transport system substrate-binding protein